jgi:hypothetical protein
MAQCSSIEMARAVAYLERAKWLVRRLQYQDAHADIKQFMVLRPGDHRAAVMQAQVFLCEGRVSDAMQSLCQARLLGHDQSENERMVRDLLVWDVRAHARAEAWKACKGVSATALSAVRTTGSHWAERAFRAVWSATAGLHGDRSGSPVSKPIVIDWSIGSPSAAQSPTAVQRHHDRSRNPLIPAAAAGPAEQQRSDSSPVTAASDAGRP